MRICLVAESYPPALGGVEYSLEKIVEGLVAKGNDVWVVTSSWQRHDARTEVSDHLRISRTKTPPFFHRFWFLLLSLPTVIKASRWADVVQGSTFAGGPPAFLGAFLLRKKKALLVHEFFGRRWFEFEPNFLRALFYFLTEWIIIRLPFDCYIAPSEYTRKALHAAGISEKKTNVIYHGDSKLGNPAIGAKDVRTRLGFRDEDFVFVAFGRTGVTKGFEYLVDAIPRILEKVPKARFLLVLSFYDRRYSMSLRRKVSDLSPEVCKLIPPQSREMLASYILASDCIVIPSLSEGFGFSALEACNAGKVVVSTDAGALPEVVFGKHVFVIPASTDAIVEGCVKACRGELEFTPAKNFSWARAVEEYMQLYRRLLNGG
jgi:D-inositol-3-phosphate glycosyltransferase